MPSIANSRLQQIQQAMKSRGGGMAGKVETAGPTMGRGRMPAPGGMQNVTGGGPPQPPQMATKPMPAPAGKLPPRFQARVDSGQGTAAGQANRYEMFKAGQLPGQQLGPAPDMQDPMQGGMGPQGPMGGPGMSPPAPGGPPPGVVGGLHYGGFRPPGMPAPPYEGDKASMAGPYGAMQSMNGGGLQPNMPGAYGAMQSANGGGPPQPGMAGPGGPPGMPQGFPPDLMARLQQMYGQKGPMGPGGPQGQPPQMGRGRIPPPASPMDYWAQPSYGGY
jgi:hypothetical protein